MEESMYASDDEDLMMINEIDDPNELEAGASEDEDVWGEAEMFIPNQKSADVESAFLKLVGLLASLGQAGVISPESVTNGMHTAGVAYKANDAGALEKGLRVMGEKASNVQKYRQPSNLLSLVQYFVDGDGTGLTMGAFREMAGAIGNAAVKDEVQRLKMSGYNAAVVNPKKFKPDEARLNAKDQVVTALKGGAKYLSQAVRWPQGTDATAKYVVKDSKGDDVEVVFGPLPLPDFDKPVTDTRTYYPNYRHGQADAFVMNVFANAAHDAWGSDRGPAILKTRNVLAEFANTHVRSNGTAAGQMARYLAVAAVSQRMGKTRRGMELAVYRAAAKRLFQFKSVSTDLPCFADGIWPPNTADLVDKAARGDTPLHSVNVHSDAGPWWPDRVLRGNTWGLDLQVADMILEDMSLFANDPEAFWTKWGFLRAAKMKPKDETTTREAFTGKTRNIYVLSSFAGVSVQLMMKRAMRSLKHSQEPGVESTCILGFVHTGGHFDRFMREVLSKPQPQVYSFSDNVYVWIPGKGWWSLDGAKQEGCATVVACQAMMQHVMKEYWGPLSVLSEENQAVFSEYWMYLTQVYPHIAIDALALLGAQYLVVPGGSSGSMVTGWLNQIVMGTPCLKLQDQLRGKEKLEGANKGNLRGPSAWFAEKYFAFDGDVPDKVNHDLQIFFNKHGVEVTLESFASAAAVKGEMDSIIPLDLLGCDMVFMRAFGTKRAIPVLQHKRCVASMAFSKRGDTSAKKTTEAGGLLGEKGEAMVSATDVLGLSADTLSKAYAIYIMGGWAYPDLRTGLAATIDSLFKSLIVTSDMPERLLAKLPAEMADSEDGEATLWPGLGSVNAEGDRVVSIRGTPTPWEVMAMFSDGEQIDEMRAWLQENWAAQSDEWLIQSVPWPELADLPGAPERLATLVPESVKKEVAMVLGSRAVEMEAKAVKPRVAKRVPVTAESVKKRKDANLTVEPPQNPQRGVRPSQHQPGEWVGMESSARVTELLDTIAQSGPVYFIAPVGADARNPTAFMRSNLANRLLSMVNGAPGVKQTYNAARKSVELYLEKWTAAANKTRRLFVVDKVSEVKGGVDLASVAPKKRFLERLEMARAANANHPIYFK